MSDDLTDKVLYRVKKVTFIRKQCRVCGGSGKRNNKSGSAENFYNCKQGVETVEHQTDISLRTALLEIGIENLIKNTVAAMQTPDDKPKENKQP